MKRLLLLSIFAALPFAAHADKLSLPAGAPPSFQGECASCHLAFPPQLMTADAWQRVMATLDRHYGDNATVDAKTRREIEDFLVKNAGTAGRVGAAAAPVGDEPPRLTATAWFKRKHHEVPRADWTHASVKSAANCAGCHSKAGAGSYREREIVMPGGRRWED